MMSLNLENFIDDYYKNVCKSFDAVNYLDLYHDAIIKIYDAKPNIETEAQLKSYFYKTAKSLYLQSKQKKTLLEISENEVAVENETKLDISRILDIPAESKDDFINKEVTKLYIELGSYKAVSKRLNIPERTIGHIVNKFIKYARNKVDH